MDVINQANDNVIRFLGGNQRRTKFNKYRWTKYLVKHKIDKGELMVNLLTGAMVMIRPFELVNAFTEDPCDYSDYLFESYFIVPEEFDEDRVIEEYVKCNTKFIDCNYLNNLKSYTILTTTKCNARCFYCYQHHDTTKQDMTEETAGKVAKYIIETSKYTPSIFIGWFGGEPLYNPDVMDIITSRVRSAGKTIRSSMISNGYLLTEDMIKRCRYDWGIDNIQITLDGTEEVYNKIKAYIYKDDTNPFKTVINNIHNALKENISISIRLNCSLKNIDDLFKLVEYLNIEFKDRNLLTVYTHQLFEINNYKLSDEDRNTLFSKLIELDNLIAKYKLHPSDSVLIGGIKNVHCMVDSGEAITINPDGSLGLCEHYIDEKSVSHIDNQAVKNYEVIRQWRNKVPYIDICNDCPLKPACLKVYGCPDDVRCSISQKDYQINKFKLGLERRYAEWLNDLNKCTNCNN